MRNSTEDMLQSILPLEEIHRFHQDFRPHFMESLNHDLWPFRVNVCINEDSTFVIAAPHGYRKDDRNTDILAHALAGKLKANAVINSNKYRKPRRAGDPKAQDIAVIDPVCPTPAELAQRKQFVLETSAIPVDLNKWPDAMVAAPDFFHPLASITSMACRNSIPLVVFVHGIADHNSSGRRNPDFVVAAGYEYDNKAEAYRIGRTTAGASVVDRLVAGLRKLERNGKQVWVEEGLPGYAAAKPERLPWIFRMLSGCTNGHLHVNAIQLEVRHKGFREVENIPSTARKLASVLTDR